MKNPSYVLPALLTFLALASPVCLAAGQAVETDSSLIGVGSLPEETGEQAEPASFAKMRVAEVGGADASGGNFVGDELFDDYENKDTKKLPSADVQATLKPVTDRLEKLVPDFAKKFTEASKGAQWILDPKPLRQDGSCQNQTSLSVAKVVRACQSKLAVRIDENFYGKSDLIRTNLNTHESLVYLALRSGGKITEEGLREASRAIRNPAISAVELKETLAKTGFGSYSTADEIAKKEQARKAAALAERKKDAEYRAHIKSLETNCLKGIKLACVALVKTY